MEASSSSYRSAKKQEQGREVLKRVSRKSHQFSVASLSIVLQTASENDISRRTVHQELCEMDFHGLAAA